jgi:hypothetical protein
VPPKVWALQGLGQIRHADFLGKRACPNDLPACGRPLQNTKKSPSPDQGARSNVHRLDRSGGYTEECCTAEAEAGGKPSEGKNETPSCEMCDPSCDLYLNGRRRDACSSNLHNKQSYYYRHANWKQFFGHQRELEFLD